MLRAKRILSALSVLPLALIGCAEVGPGDVSDAAYIFELFEQVQEAPLRVAHSGVRRLELSYDLGGTVQDLSYRERVVTDGTGRYSIETIEALTPVDSTFLPLQSERAGFYFRYRDFKVRDLSEFLANYAVYDLGQPVLFLGRTAWQFEIHTKHLESPVHYQLTFDIDTGLLLRSVELGDSGQVYARLEYETFELDPDLAGVSFHQVSNAEAPATLGPALDVKLGFKVSVPTLLPTGYRLSEVSTLVDAFGGEWVKLTYTDGVESLFFVQSRAVQPATGVKLSPTTSVNFGSPQADKVLWMQVGPIVAVQGELGGLTRLAVGKVSKEALFDLLQSSL